MDELTSIASSSTVEEGVDDPSGWHRPSDTVAAATTARALVVEVEQHHLVKKSSSSFSHRNSVSNKASPREVRGVFQS
jgi:hypothetical protein